MAYMVNVAVHFRDVSIEVSFVAFLCMGQVFFLKFEGHLTFGRDCRLLCPGQGPAGRWLIGDEKENGRHERD